MNRVCPYAKIVRETIQGIKISKQTLLETVCKLCASLCAGMVIESS